MGKITDFSELNFTPEELRYLEDEMRKYKVPWIYKIVFGSLYKWGKYFMPLLFLPILVMAIIHATTTIDLWIPIKILGFIWIFGIGIPVLISYLWNRIKVQIECKRLGLKYYQWQILAIAFQIKFI